MKHSNPKSPCLTPKRARQSATLLIFCMLALGCAGTKTVEVSDFDLAQIDTKADAQRWYHQEILRVSLVELEEQLDRPPIQRSKESLAKSYFDICAISSVYYYCVNAANNYAELVAAGAKAGADAGEVSDVAEKPDWVSRAYLGSAYALKARDYPIQGLWQVFPGPGFVRLYYLNRATSHLNAAAEAQPSNPIIRLIRSSTFISLSGKAAIGREDMQLLLSWAANPESNPEYADLLRLPAFVNEIYLEYVTQHGTDGGSLNDEEALPYWQAIAESEDNGHPVIKLAKLQIKNG